MQTPTQRKILIVEDEKSLREAIVDILKRKNFVTIEARNGSEGVEMAFAKHPDLILLDLIMPTMDGMTAFEKIRKNSWGANVPIIILTNLSATNGELAAEAAHKITHYLIKSDWKLHSIVNKIEDLLAKK
jgi:CheY-like chemotaxis protein